MVFNPRGGVPSTTVYGQQTGPNAMTPAYTSRPDRPPVPFGGGQIAPVSATTSPAAAAAAAQQPATPGFSSRVNSWVDQTANAMPSLAATSAMTPPNVQTFGANSATATGVPYRNPGEQLERVRQPHGQGGGDYGHAWGQNPQMQEYRQQFRDWRQDRPSVVGGDRSALIDWRQQRPQWPGASMGNRWPGARPIGPVVPNG